MRTPLVLLVLGLSAAPFGASAALITNGSLTGPIVNNGVPTGWTIFSGSPDTMDENNNVGTTGVPFVVAPVGPSPDGGTWVGFGRDSDSLVESFGQTVAGLSVGTTYSLSWYAGNFGAIVGSCPFYCNANAIEVLIDGVSVGTGGVLSSDRTWIAESVLFTATAASHVLGFRLASATPSYLSIDGIALDVNGAPEPGTLALLGLGLAGLAATRRRRQ